MTLVRILFILSIVAYLPSCASHATDSNKGNKLAPMQNLSQHFLLKRDQKNNTIRLLKDNNPTIVLYKKATKQQSMADVAIDFLQTYRKDFLVENPKKEFKVISNKTDDLGFTHIKLSQSYLGIPVWKGIISLHFDRQNQLQIVRGEYFPTPTNLDINAGLSSSALFKKAAILDASITPENYTLHKIIYFKNNIEPRLAYELHPTRRASLASSSFIVDAITGEVLNRLSNIQTLR